MRQPGKLTGGPTGLSLSLQHSKPPPTQVLVLPVSSAWSHPPGELHILGNHSPSESPQVPLVSAGPHPPALCVHQGHCYFLHEGGASWEETVCFAHYCPPAPRQVSCTDLGVEEAWVPGNSDECGWSSEAFLEGVVITLAE